MSATAHMMIEPLIRRHIFRNEDDAVKTLLRTYIVNQLGELQQRNDAFKRKYGMEFESFGDYLHERSELLRQDALSPEERQTSGTEGTGSPLSSRRKQAEPEISGTTRGVSRQSG